MSKIISNLVKVSNEMEWKHVLTFLSVIRVLVLAELAYVINVQIVKDVTATVCDNELNYQDVCLENEQNGSIKCLDVQCFIIDKKYDGILLLNAMNYLIKEKPNVRWPELNWFISM